VQIAGVAAAAPILLQRARALDYPTRPARIIVPFAPGGPNDVFARLLAQKLGQEFARQFYIENLGGAGSTIGTAQAARAAADGYTILVTSDAYVINPALYTKIPYDPHKDFEPITLAVSLPQVFAVNPAVPARSMAELVALVRANPGKYNYASPGTGTQPHLVGEQLRISLHLDLVHIPFSGGAPAAAAVIAGHTPIYVGSLIPVVQQSNTGKLVALAVAGRRRASALPNVPTMAQAGYPDIEGEAWIGMFVPTGTPQEIATALNHAATKIIAAPDVKERLEALGYVTIGSTSGEFAERIKTDIETWKTVIKAAGITPQ